VSAERERADRERAAAERGEQAPWSREEFEAQLRKQGAAYHIHHPFNVLLNSGKASREQIQGWVANRYYYQVSIPIKDAAILSNCPDRAVRQLGAAHPRSRRLRR
jgi:pyrroloquinoline-quinone synthase